MKLSQVQVLLAVAAFVSAPVYAADGTKSAKMGKAAKKLSAADVANLAAYYETLK